MSNTPAVFELLRKQALPAQGTARRNGVREPLGVSAIAKIAAVADRLAGGLPSVSGRPDGTVPKLVRGMDVEIRRPSLDVLCKAAELAELERTPALVATRYKEASHVSRRIKRVIKHLPASDYGYVFWNPETKEVVAVLGDGDTEQTHQKWHNAIQSIDGVKSVRTEAESGPHGDDDWIMIKRGDATLAKPTDWAGKLTGGASPLSNAIVGGLVTGGLGYGAGSLIEYLFPDEYMERGRLRRTMGLAGLAGGTAPGLWQAYANAQTSREAGQPQGWSSLWKPNAVTPPSQTTADNMESMRRGSIQDQPFRVTQAAWDEMRAGLNGLPLPDEMFLRASRNFTKLAFGTINTALGMTGGGGVRSIPVDAFNQAIWNDVHNHNRAATNPYGTKSVFGDNNQPLHTPPMIGAMATGLTSGIQQMYGGAPMLTRDHFVNGVFQATKDLVKARVGGGILGALAGVTPAGQKKLQDLGIWGGFLTGAVKTIFS